MKTYKEFINESKLKIAKLVGKAAIKALEPKKTIGDSLKKLENQDLLKFGMIPEFIGRLPVITTLSELDEDMLIKIMTQPKNAIVKQFESLLKMDGVKLEIKEDALKKLLS